MIYSKNSDLDAVRAELRSAQTDLLAVQTECTRIQQEADNEKSRAADALASITDENKELGKISISLLLSYSILYSLNHVRC